MVAVNRWSNQSSIGVEMVRDRCECVRARANIHAVTVRVFQKGCREEPPTPIEPPGALPHRRDWLLRSALRLLGCARALWVERRGKRGQASRRAATAAITDAGYRSHASYVWRRRTRRTTACFNEGLGKPMESHMYIGGGILGTILIIALIYLLRRA